MFLLRYWSNVLPSLPLCYCLFFLPLFPIDFSKAFDKVDHGILLHKLRAVGITRNIGIWLFHFLTDRSHFVRLPGGISEDHPVLKTLCKVN